MQTDWYMLEKKSSIYLEILVFQVAKTPGGGGGAVKYDIVHMRDQAFSKQPLNEFCSLPKNDP